MRSALAKSVLRLAVVAAAPGCGSSGDAGTATSSESGGSSGASSEGGAAGSSSVGNGGSSAAGSSGGGSSGSAGGGGGGTQLTSDGGVARDLHWASGDVHMHWKTCAGAQLGAASLIAQMAAADLQVGSPLVWGEDYNTAAAGFTGADDPSSQAGRILHSDMEISHFPAADMGHLNLLGLKKLDFSPTPYDSPRSDLPVVDWALAQGAGVLVGMGHLLEWPLTGYPTPAMAMWGCCVPFEFPVLLAQGKMHFLANELPGDEMTETDPLRPGGWVLWRSVQNMGFKVPLAGGSDLGCVSQTAGRMRTLTLVDGSLTYPAYIDAIRKGRTAVAIGKTDKVDLLVNGARLGDEINLANAQDVTVEVRTQLAQAEQVKIFVNGAPAAQISVGAGAQTGMGSVKVTQSAWIAAQTRKVQTSAAYALVGGAPVRASATDACYMMKYIDHLKNLVVQGQINLGGERASSLAAYDQAKVVFTQRFTESGGTTCN